MTFQYFGIFYKSSPLLATDPPPCRVFWSFEGGGVSVENQDPSGACGGLFHLFFVIVSSLLKMIW